MKDTVTRIKVVGGSTLNCDDRCFTLLHIPGLPIAHGTWRKDESQTFLSLPGKLAHLTLTRLFPFSPNSFRLKTCCLFSFSLTPQWVNNKMKLLHLSWRKGLCDHSVTVFIWQMFPIVSQIIWFAHTVYSGWSATSWLLAPTVRIKATALTLLVISKTLTLYCLCRLDSGITFPNFVSQYAQRQHPLTSGLEWSRMIHNKIKKGGYWISCLISGWATPQTPCMWRLFWR